MKGLTVELIPDLEAGGYTARVPDIAAYREGETEEEAIAVNPRSSLRDLGLELGDLVRA